MRLQKAQKEAVIAWVAEGLETDEINKRAAKFKPRFRVSKTQVAFYRKSRNHTLKEIQQTDEFAALKTGLAQKAERVDVLKRLADLMVSDLLPVGQHVGKLWIDNRKSVGMSTYDYKDFNRPEVESLRGVLEDIAKELGERAPGVQVNNTYNFNLDEWKKQRSERLKTVKDLEED